MAINYFSPGHPNERTPPAREWGKNSLYDQEDVIYGWTAPRDLQRINNRFMREPEQYDEVQVLGMGGNGKAILLSRRSDSSLLAVKISNPFKGWSTTTIAKEVFLLKHRLPENDRIIRLMNYLHSAHVPQVQIYLEYCDGGDLSQLLRRYDRNARTLPESFAWHAFRQIAEGLAFIHYGYDHRLGPNQEIEIEGKQWKKVIHADLKPENIFLRRSNSPRDYPDLVLADFGNSHTAADFHEAGTWTWLPPEKHYVSEYGDTWTMGAIISSLAWRGAVPARPSHPIFQPGLNVAGVPPIPVRHRFGSPRWIRPHCAKEREHVFVRPMLSYSHELNDLVAYTCHPHIDKRLTSWDCLQHIWYEMEVGAARSHPIVPLMFDWEPLLPRGGPIAAPPEESSHDDDDDDDDSDHSNSSNDSSDDSQNPSDRERTRKRKSVEEDSDEENNNGQDSSNQGSTRKRRRVVKDSDEERQGQHPSTRGNARKRKYSEEDSDGESYDGQAPTNREPTRRWRPADEDSDGESYDRQAPTNRQPTRRWRPADEDSDGESYDRQAPTNREPTRRWRPADEDSDEGTNDGQDSPDRGRTRKRRHVELSDKKGRLNTKRRPLESIVRGKQRHLHG